MATLFPRRSGIRVDLDIGIQRTLASILIRGKGACFVIYPVPTRINDKGKLKVTHYKTFFIHASGHSKKGIGLFLFLYLSFMSFGYQRFASGYRQIPMNACGDCNHTFNCCGSPFCLFRRYNGSAETAENGKSIATVCGRSGTGNFPRSGYVPEVRAAQLSRFGRLTHLPRHQVR